MQISAVTKVTESGLEVPAYVVLEKQMIKRGGIELCAEGAHVWLATLSLCCFVFYIVLYPLVSALYLRNKLRLSHHSKWSEKEKSLWDHFVGDDYRVECYWFRHLCGVPFQHCCDSGIFSAWVAALRHDNGYALSVFGPSILVSPVADDDRWKLYVRTALVLCSY